jgi:hypothetical protein
MVIVVMGWKCDVERCDEGELTMISVTCVRGVMMMMKICVMERSVMIRGVMLILRGVMMWSCDGVEV